MPDLEWRLVTGEACRSGSSHPAGPGRKDRRSCGAPAVAELRRGTSRAQWWAYCPDHMYGRWIEDGQVMNWILRKIP